MKISSKNVEQIANLEFKIDLLKKENLTLIENIEAQKKELENHKEQLTLQNVIAKAELDEHKRAQKAVVNSKIREEVIKKPMQIASSIIMNGKRLKKLSSIITPISKSSYLIFTTFQDKNIM